MIYAATTGGLSISTDGGMSFTNRTVANGLGSNSVNSILFQNNSIYVGTTGGLSISIDGGMSFTNRTAANGLGSNDIRGISIQGKFNLLSYFFC